MRVGARFAILSLLLGASAAACNAITGANERTLDPDLGQQPERDTGIDDDDKDTGGNTILDSGPLSDTNVVDARPDVGPTQIVVAVKGTWISPNGGTPSVVANGVKIAAMDASAANNHPVIFPSPQPQIPSDDYTVRATVVSAATGTPEFGILTRVQANGSAIVLGNVYGASPPAYLGAMSATMSPWNPSANVQGPSYTYVAGARYKMSVRVVANEARAKFWNATNAEPATEDIVYAGNPYATGRGVGFYTYFTHDTVLEEMTITVP